MSNSRDGDDACRSMLYEAIGNIEDASHNVKTAVGGDFSRVTTSILGKVSANILSAIHSGKICQKETPRATPVSLTGHRAASQRPSGAGDDERLVQLQAVQRVRGDSEQ